MKAKNRGFSLIKTLRILGIPRAWYYRQPVFLMAAWRKVQPLLCRWRGVDRDRIQAPERGNLLQGDSLHTDRRESCIPVTGNGVQDPEEKRSHNALEPDRMGVHRSRSRKEAGWKIAGRYHVCVDTGKIIQCPHIHWLVFNVHRASFSSHINVCRFRQPQGAGSNREAQNGFIALGSNQH